MQYVYPKFVVLILVVTVTCAMTALNAAAAADAAIQPAATRPAASRPAQVRPIEIIEHDFGTAWAGDMVKHTFEYANATDRVLKIQEVHAGCGGCTTTGDWARQVPPGQTWKLEVSLATANRSGPQRKAVVVTPEDPDRPALHLVLKGKVQQRFEFRPAQYVALGTVRANTAVKRTLTIRSTLKDPVTLRQPTASQSFLKASLREIEPGRTYELAVETVPPLPEQGSLGYVTIETGLKDQPQLRIPVSGSIRPRVALQPNQIRLPMPLAHALQRELRLVVAEGTKLTVDEIESSNPAITASLRTDPVRGQIIRLVMTEDLALSPQGETVTVHTDDPEFPKLTCTIRPFELRRAGAQGAASSQPAAAASQPADPTSQAADDQSAAKP